MVRLIITSLILTLALSFNSAAQTREVPKGWKEVNMCGMSFLVPKYLKEQKVQPIDSCIGEFKGKNIWLGFDYGWYTAKPGNEAIYPDSKFEWIVIDGKKAHLTTYSKGARVYIVTSEDNERKSTTALGFSVSVKKEQDAEIARKIIETIRFVNEN